MKHSTYQIILIRVFLVVYFSLLIWLLFLIRIFPFTEGTYHYHDITAQLIPLNSSSLYIRNTISNNFSLFSTYLMLSNLLGNIILFMPYGLLTPMVFPRFHQLKKIMISAFLLSLTAETIQYAFQVGVFDVDDIFLNTLGGVVGYRLLKLWEKVQFTSNKVSQ